MVKVDVSLPAASLVARLSCEAGATCPSRAEEGVYPFPWTQVSVQQRKDGVSPGKLSSDTLEIPAHSFSVYSGVRNETRV